MKMRQGFTILEVLGVLVIILVLGGVFVYARKSTSQSPSDVQATASPSPTSASVSSGNTFPSPTGTVSPAVAAGQQLSNNECSGTGTVPLTYPPVNPADVSIIEPYGLTIGGHVTPVDHEYYWAKNNVKDSSNVLALADGRLVDIEYRDHMGQGPIPGDYRVTISYTCTFMSYFDLATSLAPDIESQLPAGWEKTGHTGINIPVKAGQVIAKMGGQSLDFAVWDMTYNNPKLLVPAAYIGESWKIHTVPPLDYFSTAVKASLLPLYVRQAAPPDGYYAYDIDGKAIGTWFEQGTKGYEGAGNANPGTAGYWDGHLAIAPDFIDPTATGFSIGDYQGQATQFTITPGSTDPATVGVETGLVKYQLLHTQRYIGKDGNQWDGLSTPKSALTLLTNGAPEATALIQLTAARTMKVELFPNKTPGQVSGFDSAARVYTRDGN